MILMPKTSQNRLEPILRFQGYRSKMTLILELVSNSVGATPQLP